MWRFLVQHANDYGFLGPIVGIVGLLMGASAAIFFAFTRTLDTWKPPLDTFPRGLDKIVGMLCAVGLFIAWIRAEPTNGPDYLHATVYLAVAAVVAFLIYVGLRAYVGRFRKPLLGPNNSPAGEEVIWGGLWLWRDIRKKVRSDNSVEKILAGKLYDRSQVWPPLSLTFSAVTTALVLIALLVCATLALSTAGASIQVALTGK